LNGLRSQASLEILFGRPMLRDSDSIQVGATGFEPATSWTPSIRAIRVPLRD